MQPDFVTRFWAKVDKNGPFWNGTACWMWTGAQNGHGYGHLRSFYRNYPAHRVAYELAVGAIPSGMEMDHLCRVPLCVNPDHLEPVHHWDNVRRGHAGIKNRAKTHCPRGHPYDGADGRVNRAGSRYCLACQRRDPRPPRLLCRHGHAWIQENLYVRPDGWTECRTCRVDRMQRYLERQRQR